uniref:Uncharacterized protein n=1 Tax=Plectus sambesii TaxID=2011161 RepID=A0A914VH35_9BILA
GATVKCVLVEFLFFWCGLKNVDEQHGFKLSTSLAFIIDICFLMAAMTLPTVLFMLVCRFMVAAFRDNEKKFAALAELSVEHLSACYQEYLKLAQLTDDVSECFEDVTFFTMLFLIPVICTTALNFTRFGGFVVIVVVFFVATISTFVQTMRHGIWLNEQSRRVRCCLYQIFPFDQSIKSGIDHVMHKVNDWSWGVRIGKLMVMDRTTCIAILSAMITFVALWAQMSANAEMCDNGEMLVWNETAIVNNMFMDLCE